MLLAWTRRWYKTSTLALSSRWHTYALIKAGRWLQAEHPDRISPRILLRPAVQEWEWIERRFDPRRALGIPRSIAALISSDPRVIAEEVWAN
ncbi:MAG: hypothetical protein ACLP50_01325 [Solirubrobacteraceae bacterium]